MKILKCNDLNELSSKSYYKLGGGKILNSGLNLMLLPLSHTGTHTHTKAKHCKLYTTVMATMRSENNFYNKKEAHYPS